MAPIVKGIFPFKNLGCGIQLLRRIKGYGRCVSLLLGMVLTRLGIKPTIKSDARPFTFPHSILGVYRCRHFAHIIYGRTEGKLTLSIRQAFTLNNRTFGRIHHQFQSQVRPGFALVIVLKHRTIQHKIFLNRLVGLKLVVVAHLLKTRSCPSLNEQQMVERHQALAARCHRIARRKVKVGIVNITTHLTGQQHLCINSRSSIAHHLLCIVAHGEREVRINGTPLAIRDIKLKGDWSIRSVGRRTLAHLDLHFRCCRHRVIHQALRQRLTLLVEKLDSIHPSA